MTAARQDAAQRRRSPPGQSQRLINPGVSAETLKVILRHKDFATTEKHYARGRSAQAAARELATCLTDSRKSPP